MCNTLLIEDLINIHIMYHRARSVRSMLEIPTIIYYFFSENVDNNLGLWFQFTGFVYELKFPKRELDLNFQLLTVCLADSPS